MILLLMLTTSCDCDGESELISTAKYIFLYEFSSVCSRETYNTGGHRQVFE